MNTIFKNGDKELVVKYNKNHGKDGRFAASNGSSGGGGAKTKTDMVHDALKNTKGSMDAEEVASATGMTTAEARANLTLLEFMGNAKTLNGRHSAVREPKKESKKPKKPLS